MTTVQVSPSNTPANLHRGQGKQPDGSAAVEVDSHSFHWATREPAKMSLSIPSFAYLERKHLAVEFNGTLAVDSPLLPSQHKRILWMAGDSEPRILPIHLAATQTDVQVCGDFPQRFGRNITNH